MTEAPSLRDQIPLRDQISAATKSAMREKDTVRLSTLRLMSAAIKDRDIAARAADRCGGIEDVEILGILTKMVKQREEAAQTYEDNGRPELAEREREEIETVRAFMPTPMTDTEIEAAVATAVEKSGATCLKDMGKVMGQLKTGYAGRIDMGKAGAVVKRHLCS
ncbi:MAG: GatB/YqeY domain-containing protein [Litorimonas sp.]